MSVKISIGADHRGYDLKNLIIKHFTDHQWRDVGAHSPERSDYPIYTKKVCDDVVQNISHVGIFVCGSGTGPCIAANRYKGLYAAVCWNEEIARLAKEKCGVTILILPADYLEPEQAFSIVKTWLSASFHGGIYEDRLIMIDQP